MFYGEDNRPIPETNNAADLVAKRVSDNPELAAWAAKAVKIAQQSGRHPLALIHEKVQSKFNKPQPRRTLGGAA